MILPIVALLGVGLAVFMVLRGQREPEPARPIVTPPYSPYETFISGSGIIEASSTNVAVGAPSSGIIEAVFIEAGQEVVAGQPLFRLDTRELVAELQLHQSLLTVAESRVVEENAVLKDVKSQLSLAERIRDKRAISVEELDRRRYAVELAEAKLLTAEAEVIRHLAEVNLIKVEIDRLTVRAPIDGVILQENLNVGEYVFAGNEGDPLVLMGVITPMHVRVDIDETDAWRFRPGEPAIGVLRGNPDVRIPLTFVSYDPYIIPKRSLTGEQQERVDTRVLQVIYEFDPTGYPVYIGQQMDVYVEVPSSLAVSLDLTLGYGSECTLPCRALQLVIER